MRHIPWHHKHGVIGNYFVMTQLSFNNLVLFVVFKFKFIKLFNVLLMCYAVQFGLIYRVSVVMLHMKRINVDNRLSETKSIVKWICGSCMGSIRVGKQNCLHLPRSQIVCRTQPNLILINIGVTDFLINYKIFGQHDFFAIISVNCVICSHFKWSELDFARSNTV